MATGEVIGCFGLTEPDAGSDPASMQTRAQRNGTDWILDRRKTWITSGNIADVAIVWARADDGIRGFLVPTCTPGFSAAPIKHKASLRASITSELVLEDVRVPADAMLPGTCGLSGPLSCRNEARYGIVWGAMGAARSCFMSALEYAANRTQFGTPIAGFHLTQAKLADMAVELSKGMLLALHLGRRKDVRSASANSTTCAKHSPSRTARTILGGNGISREYPVIRHLTNSNQY